MSTSAQRKLARGIELTKSLLEEVGRYESSRAYTFRVETEELSASSFRYRSFFQEHEPPPSHWPLVAGDAIHNLRCALDHVVWQAWFDAGNQGDGDHTQFPIALSEDHFRGQAHRLVGVPVTTVDLIEGQQPYRKSPQWPDEEALYLLYKLSNADKHRILVTVAVTIEFEGISTDASVEIPDWKHGTGHVLGSGERQVASFVVTSKDRVRPPRAAPQYEYQVQIEGKPVDTLRYIAKRVFEAVATVEGGAPLHPLAPYPI